MNNPLAKLKSTAVYRFVAANPVAVFCLFAVAVAAWLLIESKVENATLRRENVTLLRINEALRPKCDTTQANTIQQNDMTSGRARSIQQASY
jgi:hypothetical protein